MEVGGVGGRGGGGEKRAPVAAARSALRRYLCLITGNSSMPKVTYRDAIRMALADEMRSDSNVVFFGEDVAVAGGVFKVTPGLYEEFGPVRVRDTPISETAIVGAGLGAALTGVRPG